MSYVSKFHMSRDISKRKLVQTSHPPYIDRQRDALSSGRPDATSVHQRSTPTRRHFAQQLVSIGDEATYQGRPRNLRANDVVKQIDGVNFVFTRATKIAVEHRQRYSVSGQTWRGVWSPMRATKNISKLVIYVP